MEPVYELYYNTEYKRKYYYDPVKKESLWDVPPTAKIIDKRSEEEKKLDQPASLKPPVIISAQVIPPEHPEYAKLVELYPGFFDQKEREKQEAQQKGKKRPAPEGGKTEPVEEEKAPVQQPLTETLPEQKSETKKKYIAFRTFKKKHVEELMKRPARRQIKDIKKDTAYQEGNYDYNIWYDKYLTDRRNEQEKAPSLYKCDPELDTGYTRADLMEKTTSYFCVYFARGCCAEGSKCRFYHRVPQPEDLIHEENAKDVFGRTRHATIKEDRTGIGSFNRNCRAINICNMKVPESAGSQTRDTVKLLYDEFSKWGEIEDIKFYPHRAMANIKYTHRFYAEFAKEAMQDQSLGGTDVLLIKWHLEEDPRSMKTKEQEQKELYLAALRKKKELEDQRALVAQQAAEEEKRRLEEVKQKQKAEYEKVASAAGAGAMYNPAFYKDVKPGVKLSREVREQLEKEREKVTENCAKLNEVLQRISYNYQENQ